MSALFLLNYTHGRPVLIRRLRTKIMAFTPTREGQLSEEKLKWGYWWVTHKVQVRRWFILVMIILDLIVLAYVGYGFVDWFFLSGAKERADIGQMVQNPIDYASFRAAAKPVDLVYENPLVLQAGEGAYDIASKVTNDNTKWWADFNYRFIMNEDPNSSPKAAYGFVLPGDSTYLSTLGWKTTSTPAVRLEISNMQWHRISPHTTFPTYDVWKAEHLNLVIEPEPFRPALSSDPLHVSKAVFQVTNDSAYGLRTARFFVILYSDQAIVGVNDVTIGRLMAGDGKTVEVSWFSDLPTVTSVEVIPIINLMDPMSFVTVGQ